MHPYRMQTLIKQRGKGEIANVTQRNSVYQTIASLRRSGLIAVRETEQEDRRPERTLYAATAEGRRTLRSWIRTGLSTLAREYPEFPAVLATLYGVESPVILATLLDARLEVLETRLTALEQPVPVVPRLFLLEGEYMAAMVRAECKWLRALTSELRLGQLPFPTRAEMLKISTDLGAPSPEALRNYAKELHTSSGLLVKKPKSSGTGAPAASKKRNIGPLPKAFGTRKKAR